MTKEKPRADEPSHAQNGGVDTEEPVTQFKAKLNKYGFIHITKRTWKSLPFEMEKPLTARIDCDQLIIAAAK
jgi:hypothetical protein